MLELKQALVPLKKSSSRAPAACRAAPTSSDSSNSRSTCFRKEHFIFAGSAWHTAQQRTPADGQGAGKRR